MNTIPQTETTWSVRRHTAAGLEVVSTHDSIDEALDARQDGQVVWHDSEDREATESEIFG